MRIFIFTVLIFSGILLGSVSCRKNFEYDPSSGKLSFSQDTVFLDTVFNTIGSSTYSLTVYNETRDDVEIPSIRLVNGSSSFYRLNVDGVAGKNFKNIAVKAQDSMFIFIEITANDFTSTETNILYTDAIAFDSGADQQEVALVTLVKDAIFLYPRTDADGIAERIVLSVDADNNEKLVDGFQLSDTQLRFTNEKPYIIYGYAAVPTEKELIIEAGARIHFHKDSGLFVSEGASIQVQGEVSQSQELMEGEVIFEGDRLEPSFSEVPGQWGAIYIASGSRNNMVEYATIKNGSIGLFLEGDNLLVSPTLEINNSRIYNNSRHNLWARTAFVMAKNLVLGSSGNASLYCNLGGNYSFTHCTIANYWNKGFRTSSALVIDNVMGKTETNFVTEDLINAHFKNCIIDGNSQIELALVYSAESQFNYNFSDCALKFVDFSNQFVDDPLYNFNASVSYTNLLLNSNSDFFFPARNDFRIGLESAVINKGSLEIAQQVPFDILGNDRSLLPDLGAYQAITKE